MRHVLVSVMLLAAPAVSGAQEAPSTPASVAFPGSVNMTIGNVTPTERGNVVSLTQIEQGVTVWRHNRTFVSGLALLSVGRDSDHYAWNNRHPVTLGVRLSQVMSNSVLQLNVGESVVSDAATPTVVKPVAYASYWAGWRHAVSGGRFTPRALPGSFWITSGVVTALEPDNWITAASFDQGATVYERGRTSLIPYTRLTANGDTRGFGWNNRTSVDAGLKVRRTIMGGVVDAGVAARRQYERISGTSRTTGVAFVELWYGWNPRVVIH
jgi:hypothetical protein